MEAGKWHIFRHLNGDQTHQGRHICIFRGEWGGKDWSCMGMNDKPANFNHIAAVRISFFRAKLSSSKAVWKFDNF